MTSIEKSGRVVMQLWIVSRREPLKVGNRVVHVYRFAVLADSAENAIEKAKEKEVPSRLRGTDPSLDEWLTGDWSASPDGSEIVSLRTAMDTPTPAEVADRDARKERRTKRAPKPVPR